MTAFDEPRELQHVDAAFRYTGIFGRAIGYAVIYAIADEYDFGRALLSGVLLGDFLGQLVKVAWQWRSGWLEPLNDLLVLLLVFLLARPALLWPEDPAMRAILGLAAFGLIVGHIGGTALTRLGPSQA